MRVLILCTGNSCRSQMAMGIIRAIHPEWQVDSAGTQPAYEVHPIAIKVMQEWAIDLSKERPQQVDKFTDRHYDYVITVCDDANENCPIFIGKVEHRLHMGFEDPAQYEGTDDEKIAFFRKIRNEILVRFFNWMRNIEFIKINES